MEGGDGETNKQNQTSDANAAANRSSQDRNEQCTAEKRPHPSANMLTSDSSSAVNSRFRILPLFSELTQKRWGGESSYAAFSAQVINTIEEEAKEDTYC
jgi:hypothetical protein